MPPIQRRIEPWLFRLVWFVIGFAVTAVGVSFVLNRSQSSPNPEAQYLRQRFGTSKNSEGIEEWVVRDFFHGERNGVFVDVGAGDYRKLSNTYYLESELGWSGLAVDPLKQFEADYLRYRPRTRFRAFFVSDHSDDQATLYVLKGNTTVTSSDRTFA